MKKLITLFTLALITNLSFAQVVFQSDLSSWAAGNPTDFFGTKTSVASSNVTEITTGATYGSSYANIINTSSSSHKRLTTQAVTVIPGTTYKIQMWVSTVSADTTELRVSMYDLTNASWTSYTAYQDVTGTAITMYIDSVVAPAGCTSLEFILSFKNTNALGFNLDSVSISGPLAPPPALTQIDLPVTFEGSTVNYTMTDFGNNASMLMVDPTNAANKVMRIIKPTGAQPWAGTTISTPTGFATAIPFTTTDQKMTVRVWSAATGTPIRLKVEDATNATISCETEALTVTAGGWDTLTFDFGSPATGTAALNIANTYDKASIFMDFSTAGAQDTFYFDDVMFLMSPPPALSQIDLPVTFEDTTVDYTMTDFGNNASMLMVDPTNAANKVMRIIKPTGAQPWAGTTISTATGFATLLPFSTTDHTMNVRVWSPDSNTVIRLKVEDANDVTHTCETEATTTINGGWEILNFNFSNEATGTAALATGLAGGWVYNKASIFFDFNNAGSGKVYYFDDVKWGGNYAGARELTIENLNVYPNPTSNTWNITNGGNIINQIDIYDLKGKLIETSNPNSNKVKINAINYPSGIYIIKAITNNGVANKRVVKN